MSGKENKVRDLLLNRAITTKTWGDTIQEILVPTEKEYVTKNNVRKIVDRKVYPGYVFVKMHVNDDTERLVQGTEGVTGFVRSGAKPVPLTDQEAKYLLNLINKVDEDVPKSKYSEKDIVKIVTGPFADFNGSVAEVDEIKGKVKAYINIFGRDTLVELDMQDIEPAHI